MKVEIFLKSNGVSRSDEEVEIFENAKVERPSESEFSWVAVIDEKNPLKLLALFPRARVSWVKVTQES